MFKYLTYKTLWAQVSMYQDAQLLTRKNKFYLVYNTLKYLQKRPVYWKGTQQQHYLVEQVKLMSNVC